MPVIPTGEYDGAAFTTEQEEGSWTKLCNWISSIVKTVECSPRVRRDCDSEEKYGEVNPPSHGRVPQRKKGADHPDDPQPPDESLLDLDLILSIAGS
jgi:hypothetical protein